MSDLELDPCPHGELHPSLCLICKDQPAVERTPVYFTGGGQHYHLDPKCVSLADGQKIVEERGGTPAPLENGYLDTVRLSRKPCKTCAR